jgi:hypothetical protein
LGIVLLQRTEIILIQWSLLVDLRKPRAGVLTEAGLNPVLYSRSFNHQEELEIVAPDLPGRVRLHSPSWHELLLLRPLLDQVLFQLLVLLLGDDPLLVALLKILQLLSQGGCLRPDIRPSSAATGETRSYDQHQDDCPDS